MQCFKKMKFDDCVKKNSSLLFYVELRAELFDADSSNMSSIHFNVLRIC